jgi:hydrogenase expression/formation protein HypD
MRFVDEYRDGERAASIIEAIGERAIRPATIMEVCGGQTHTLIKSGIDRMLPESISLIHGPGCPVCVTPLGLIDQAIAIARRPEVIFTSFADMLRVPGSHSDLLATRAQGADVRMVYSPLDALRLASDNPDRQVVFFAVGFETTAPANAMAVLQAQDLGVANFSLLSAQVTVPPAMAAILEAEDHGLDAFIAAGHVCSVMGTREYQPLADKHRLPIVVAGFEPLDLLLAIYMAVDALAAGRSDVENQYRRVVRPEGNVAAQKLIERVFVRCNRRWRGIGTIEQSGLALRDDLMAYDAGVRFEVSDIDTIESSECQSGLVLQGRLKPPACPAFGARCTPQTPLGAPMVSSEGACAAYYAYGVEP